MTDRPLQGSEDWIFFAALTAAGIMVDVVREPLVRYRVHASNSTADPHSLARSMWNAMNFMVDKGLIAPAAAPRSRAVTARTIARGYAAQREWGHSRSWLRRSLDFHHPANAVMSIGAVAATSLKSAVVRRGETR